MYKRIVIITIMMIMFAQAQAQRLNLTGGEVVNQGVCKHTDGKVYQCIAVVLETKMYNVLIDEDGEVAIYLVTKQGSKLVWARNSV